MTCASSCNTKDHPTYGECLRSQELGTLYIVSNVSATEAKAFDAEIQAYRSAVRQGVEPDGSRMPQIQEAMRISNETGVPYKSTV